MPNRAAASVHFSTAYKERWGIAIKPSFADLLSVSKNCGHLLLDFKDGGNGLHKCLAVAAAGSDLGWRVLRVLGSPVFSSFARPTFFNYLWATSNG